jgi:hypothetical protein
VGSPVLPLPRPLLGDDVVFRLDGFVVLAAA